MISLISYGNIVNLFPSSKESDRTEIYTPRLSSSRNIQQSKENHELHEIAMMMPYSNS